jgi:hypothetical protein
MEGIAVAPEAGPPGSDAPRMNFVQRIVGMYTSPQETFEDINRNGSWLAVYIIMAVLVASIAYLPQTRMDHETYMRKALEMNPMTKNMSEEQIKQIVDRPVGAFQKYSGPFLAALGALVVYVVCAASLLLVIVLMGGALTFKKSLSLTIWGMAPPGIVGGLLAILFMFIKDPDTLEIDASANVASNLGMLVSKKEHAVLHSLLGSIDIFSVWTIILLAIGFSVASGGKLSRGKAAAGIVSLWVVYVALKLGFVAIFS